MQRYLQKVVKAVPCGLCFMLACSFACLWMELGVRGVRKERNF